MTTPEPARDPEAERGLICCLIGFGTGIVFALVARVVILSLW